MALNKQAVPINFSQGLDLKTDPWQVAAGKFLSLQNSVFDIGGMLKKRNGFKKLSDLPDTSAQFVTKFNGNLVAVGDTLASYSSGSASWASKGTLQPATVNVTSLFKSDIGQSQCDSVVHPNGLVCTVMTNQVPTGGGVLTPAYMYAISDSVTGEQVVPPTNIPIALGTIQQPAKVFLLGNYFVIVFTNLVSGTNDLQYVAINAYTPTVTSANTNISTVYAPGTAGLAPQFEGCVFNNRLYLAWRSTDGGGAIRVNTLDSTLALGSPVTLASQLGEILTVCADANNSIIYVSAYRSSTQTAKVYRFDSGLGSLGAAVTALTGISVANMTSAAQAGTLTLFYEQVNTYSYGSRLASNNIQYVTVSQDGTTIGQSTQVARSVGLASKACIINGAIYVLGTYVSTFQPTYFLLKSDGSVVAKLAYANGPGSYYTQGLTSASVTDSTVMFAYLIKDRIEAVNKTQNLITSGGIYSQTGVNLADIDLTSANTDASEIGRDLHITGGFLWMYDGFSPVEHGFHLWPDNVQAAGGNGGGLKAQKYLYVATYEWTDAQGNIHRSAPSIPIEVDLSNNKGPGVKFQATFTIGDTTFTVSSVSGLFVGMTIQDDSQSGAFPANTKITNVGATTITVNNAAVLASASSPGDNMSTTGIATRVTFTANSTSLQASSVANFFVGQELTDLTTPANLPANTLITAIDTTNKILTISNPTTAASASDQISTAAPTAKAYFPAGATELYVTSTDGFVVGAQITDSTSGAAFQSNTRITAIDPANYTITIDKPTVAGTGTPVLFYNRVGNGTPGSVVNGAGSYPSFGYINGDYATPYITAPANIPSTGQGIYCDRSITPQLNIVSSVSIVLGNYVAFATYPIPPTSSPFGVFTDVYIVDVHTITSPAAVVAATFTSGSTVLNVTNTANFYPGQTISDLTTPGNITAGTKVVSVDATAKTITIDTPTAGATASEVVQTTDVFTTTVNIPTLRLTYKTPNPVRIALYRWSTNQQTYYQVTPVLNPLLNNTGIDSVAYVDTSPDYAIQGNNVLYTTGGVVENIAAPPTNITSLYRSRLFLVNAENPNQLWYSKQVIENTPAEMSDLFTIYVAPTTAAQGDTGPITALAALDDKLIVFKNNAIYYIVGNGPDNTGNNNDFGEPVFISSAIGCNNPRSIVFTPSGLMFQSDKGIWMLGRDLSTAYIGAPVENLALEGRVVSAVNVPETNQVRFMLDTGVTLMYDYYFQQWGTFTNIPGVSSVIYQSLHTFINSRGEVYQENPGSYLDGGHPVLLGFTTSWLNLAGLQGYERAYFFYLLGKFLSPHKINIQIAYDYNSTPMQQTVIVPDNYTAPWGGEQLWGSGGGWGGNGNVEQHRVFLQQQKCQAFQVTLNEIYDPSQGVVAGAGLTLSGLNAVVGLKSSYPRLRASKSVG